MRKCRLCGTPIFNGWDYCTQCYQKTITELEREMKEKEGPVSASDDVDRTLTE